MNSGYFSRFLFIACFLFVACGLFAQQKKVNKDVKVVREYTPIISDAYKINKLPSLGEEDTHSEKINFDYDILKKNVAYNFTVEPIVPAGLQNTHKTILDRSYVKGAVGSYNTIYGELFYNILHSEKYALGLNISHTSSMGDVTLEDGTKSDAPFHNTGISMSFKRFMKKNTLSVNAEFLHNVYKYYGFQNVDNKGTYGLASGQKVSGRELMPEDRQRLSGFKIGVGFNNKELDVKNTPYDVNLKLGTFSNLTGVKENSLSLYGNVKLAVNSELSANIGVGIKSYTTSVPTSTKLYDFKKQNQSLFTLLPNLEYDFDAGSVKIGADVFVQGGVDYGDEVNFAPHVEGNLVIAKGVVSAFGGIKGDYIMNNYEKIQRENYYVAADQMVRNAFNSAHFFGGLRGKFNSALGFMARVDYASFKNDHYFVNRTYTSVANTIAQSNLFDVVYDDGNVLTISGELKYEFNEKMNMLLSGKYNKWDLDNLDHAWYKPETEVNFNVNFSPMEDLWINAGVGIQGKRFAKGVQVKELDTAINFNVNGEYNISSKWNVFAGINNMLTSKYYQWNGYPIQRFNFRAGVGYSF